MEGTIGNREMFEKLHAQAISLEPNAPLLRLSHARDTWTEFKDGPACLELIAVLEDLLASERWNREGDLAPLAYQKKIETLKAKLLGGDQRAVAVHLSAETIDGHDPRAAMAHFLAAAGPVSRIADAASGRR